MQNRAQHNPAVTLIAYTVAAIVIASINAIGILLCMAFGVPVHFSWGALVALLVGDLITAIATSDEATHAGDFTYLLAAVFWLVAVGIGGGLLSAHLP